MPSLQEALQKAINEWAEPEDQQQEKQMTKSEIIFNYIRDHEGCTPKALIDTMLKQGIKVSTTETMIGKFIKAGMVARDEVCNELFVKTPKYMPLLTFAKENGTLKKKRVLITRRSKTPEPISLSPLPDIFKAPKKEWHPDDILNELSVVQARKLYDALMALFTGRQV
jgi:hypothetical protein